MTYPKTTVDMTSEQKIQKKLDSWKAWGDKMAFLKSIHEEPSVVEGIKRLRQQSGDEIFDN